MTMFSKFELIVLFYGLSSLTVLIAVKCHLKNWSIQSNDESCEGDFCIVKRGTSTSPTAITQTCIIGAKMPSYNCSLDVADALQCYCGTDFCNDVNLLKSNFTILPTIECKKVLSEEYKPAACNKCKWTIDYIKYDGSLSDKFTDETVNCGDSGESADIIFDTDNVIFDRIGPNFFSDACYNVTMNPQQYTVYCRCSYPNCNDPEKGLPYPFSPPTITCYTSGYDGRVNNAKYDTPKLDYFTNYENLIKNESYYDEGIQCRGHFCFITIVDHTSSNNSYYKGCITANEQGEHRIQLGHSYLNDVPYYICDTDFCNLNIETTLKVATNSTEARDNSSKSIENLNSCLLIYILQFVFSAMVV
ncbi:UPAR/Ly6 domain-containing protein [Caenorhabditis elegans]|uniref:UPAR/Ly6 domain-containing protein n=1 Tax=Caenorhabditis elegans TaxID=6239 RepID=P91987_CAEEL|nr:UPAR/Ly6 domain-containing protein [Caenorhabditis elegans]CAB02990.1 UPAR/Ly6 domain-containing protein [Caenorhabditis elegans]|eukprot:NP_506336.1 LU (Ly6 Urokinase plasminogen) domain Receptor-related Protein [Caenorhabditis elegans]